MIVAASFDDRNGNRLPERSASRRVTVKLPGGLT
jgi:hypothetical protein